MASSAACAGFFFEAEPLCEPSAPALDACALCAKPLGLDSDIFMYRGDTPFCSEDCRYEQMQIDAIRARSVSRAAEQQQHSSSGADAPSRGQQESRKVSVVS